MAKPPSEDLRYRLVAAVDGGMSRRAAAERFGVAAASAVRWVQAWRTTGTMRAKPQGGDKRSHLIEGYRDIILAAIEAQVDITLVELADMLRCTHGTFFAPSTIWRFLDRHAMTVIRAAIEARGASVSFWNYLGDRLAVTGSQPIPLLPSLVSLQCRSA